RPDSGVAVERPEADRHLVTLRPRAAEQRRAAHRAEHLHRRPARWTEDAEQPFARDQPEAVPRDAPLRQAERPRALPADRAVAVVRPAERLRDLEANAAAQTASLQRLHRSQATPR